MCHGGLLALSGGGQLVFPRGWAVGVFSDPYEKTEMFLTASKSQDPAAPSGLSDERSRRQSLREEFWPRWQKPDLTEQLETPPFLKLEHKTPHSSPGRNDTETTSLSPSPPLPTARTLAAPSPSQPMLEAGGISSGR